MYIPGLNSEVLGSFCSGGEAREVGGGGVPEGPKYPNRGYTFYTRSRNYDLGLASILKIKHTGTWTLRELRQDGARPSCRLMHAISLDFGYPILGLALDSLSQGLQRQGRAAEGRRLFRAIMLARSRNRGL